MPEFIIGVEYCGLPRCCGTCGVFGHDCSLPPAGVPTKRVWRRKQANVLALGQTETAGADVGISLPEQVVQDVGEKEIVQDTGKGATVDKGKKVMEDSTPPVTPSALPSQEEFNKVINGAKARSNLKLPTPVLHSNAFELLCGQRDIILQAPPKKGGRDGLRSKGGTTKVVATRK
ncbi:unnamed protein product [Linum trigynum]|uniref:Uncharacterized protein n=1 Tax=Linum trigynum TaxID=586398 RepID=A0AAV2DTJ1_9ROSI